ncbi:MAG: hypothetical protein WAM79_04675 [Candidatus Sulfotelmatobacter sp.]
MRRVLSLTFVCAFFCVAVIAHAQQVDVAVGGNTLWSPLNRTASEGFLPPPEKGGIYPSISAEYISDNHFGLLAEGAFRYHETLYNGFQPYRPIFYDINGVYTARLARKTRGDFMAGVGAQTILFPQEFNNCGISVGGCRMFLNSTHFATHFGVGIRYALWRNFFVRPEAHWYYVVNNFQFHSANVLRVGVSVGYTFGEHPPRKKKQP